MKCIIVTIVFLGITGQGFLSSIVTDEPVYTFIKKDKDITLFYRWIDNPGKKPVRELKAEFNISSTPTKVIAVLKDEKLASQWMKGVSEFRLLDKNQDKCWNAYILYDIPWPLSNQDCIIRYEMKNEPTGKIWNVLMNGIPDYIPKKQGVTRISHLQGNWKLSDTGKNGCHVVYTIFSKQPPMFPRWITDPIIQGNLINTLIALKNTVEKN